MGQAERQAGEVSLELIRRQHHCPVHGHLTVEQGSSQRCFGQERDADEGAGTGVGAERQNGCETAKHKRETGAIYRKKQDQKKEKKEKR